MNNLALIQENRFGSRKRGANTIPAKIFRTYPNNFNISQKRDDSSLNINFYRQPNNTIFKKLLFTYSKSKEELLKDGIFFEKTRYMYLRYQDKIFSNGFYYSKYYNMQYYPTYFYKITIDSKLLIVNYQSKHRFKYGIYNRNEYNDKEILLNYLKNNNINKEDVLILGNKITGFECTTDQKYFFNSFKTYLINNEDNDAVSNTLLEAIYYKKKFKLMNNLAIANDNKALLEAYNYYGYSDFFNKLDNLNNFCWKDLKKENFYTKYKYLNNIYKKSKTFTEFLDYF
jgi:hypothetical protein